MKEPVLVFEGETASDGTNGTTHAVRPPVKPAASEGSGVSPHPMYSIEGLRALALAVRDLDVSA